MQCEVNTKLVMFGPYHELYCKSTGTDSFVFIYSGGADIAKIIQGTEGVGF